MKRMLLFALMLLLVGAAVPGEARAEEYLSVYEVLDKLNVDYASSGDEFYSYLNYSIFLITNSYDADGNLVRKNLYVTRKGIYGWETVYNCVLFNSSMGPITSDARNYDITNGEVVFTRRTDCSDAVPLLYLNQTHEIVYANFDTSVLSDCPYFIDLSNDDLDVSGSLSLDVVGTSASVAYTVTGEGFENYYIELFGSETLDGTYSSFALSENYTVAGSGTYTFDNLIPGNYYKAQLKLNDGTLLATSDIGYVLKDDAVVELDVSESGGTIIGTYALSGGKSITADVYLQESLDGSTWIDVDSITNAAAGTGTLSCDAQDLYKYRLYTSYVCNNDDGVDVSGTAESAVFTYAAPTPTPTPSPTPTATPTPTPTPVPSGTISLNIKDSTAKADYEISGGFESFYLELLSSETLDGTFTKLAVSRNFTSSGTGSYTFNNVLQPGSYYMANLFLSDNTLLAQSEKGYVVKDDAVVGLDIFVSEDGIVSGSYALSGGQAITADIHLQESKSGFAWDEWTTVDTVSSVTGEGIAFAYAAKDYHYYRFCCEYVCNNDDGVDVSGTRYSAKVQRTLPPSPDLMEDSNDFFSMFIIMMLLMQEFPLNLFLVAMVIVSAVLVFSMLFKGGKNV